MWWLQPWTEAAGLAEGVTKKGAYRRHWRKRWPLLAKQLEEHLEVASRKPGSGGSQSLGKGVS